MRNARSQRYSERLQRQERGVAVLVDAFSAEESESGVVAQAVVDRQFRQDAPCIFGIQAQSLDILREISARAKRSRGRIWRAAELHGLVRQILRKLGRIRDIKTGIS